jgi:hypothetical protein
VTPQSPAWPSASPSATQCFQHHIRPLLTRSVKACTTACCTWILRWVWAQRLVEFPQLRKHSSSSKRRHLSSMLGWTHTRPGHDYIIKQCCHGVFTWLKQQRSRPPIYSNGAQHRSPFTSQMAWQPYQDIVCTWCTRSLSAIRSIGTSAAGMMTSFQSLSFSGGGGISMQGQVLCRHSAPMDHHTTTSLVVTPQVFN